MEPDMDAREGDMATRLLAPIMDQLAALQRQVAGMGNDTVPTPDKVARDLEKPDIQELALRKAPNREQFHFCRTVSGFASKALELFQPDGSLQNTVGAAPAIRDLLRAIEEASTKRQKLIKLADRSDAGWATVTRYMADPIADDSADEKRIRTAEKQALAGIKSQGKNHVLMQVGRIVFNKSVTKLNNRLCITGLSRGGPNMEKVMWERSYGEGHVGERHMRKVTW